MTGQTFVATTLNLPDGIKPSVESTAHKSYAGQ